MTVTNVAAQQDTGTIEILGPKPLVINMADTKKRPALDEDEARMITSEIQRTSVRLWLLVTEAHDRKAHAALGYETWDDYVRAELKLSPARSYQLIDTGRVMRALAGAGADIDHLSPPPTRVVNRIKDRLPEVRRVVRAAVKEHESLDKALREIARAPRAPSERGDGSERGQPSNSETGRGRGPVVCPACGGEGKVSRSVAPRLRAFLREKRE